MKLKLIFVVLVVFTSACSKGSSQTLDSQASKSGFSSQKELEKAAQKGDSKALFILASSYATNSDSFDDQKKAFHLFEQAANLGNDEAMLQLGLLYQDGSSYVKEIDNQKALLWYKRAAEKNNIVALHNIGVAYYDGVGVTENKSKAYQYLQKAAKLGFLQSQKIIAYQLYTGTGVNKDLEQSFYWSMKAAEQGDIKSQNNVALNFEKR
ncbi:tetratricopeptide repeat protein [Acinetobacter vivianii]|uniref:tetratricopeptide repeat protein n=1 Tax=Acinetobacter vivianii TaxID=1776742 RepID=UPI001D0F4921|nr:tetratricopeptide repeat protein [Acinetobacter vivianii]